MKTVHTLTLLIAASSAVVISAPIASANTESQFLDELRTNHVALPGKDSQQTVAAGYATCGHLKHGTSVLDEMSAVERQYTFDQGTLFVSAATTNLCPDFAAHQ